MIYKYSEADRAIIEEVAAEAGVDALLLSEKYEQVMYRNFWQTLWDIAKEYEEELKGE